MRLRRGAFLLSAAAAVAAFAPRAVHAQAPAPSISESQADLFTGALLGRWLGKLEYRDYADDARVVLPTLLLVTPAASGAGVTFAYTYDDGNGTSGKIVSDREDVLVDVHAVTLVTHGADGGIHASQIDDVRGFTDAPVGTLVVLGVGTENDKPVQTRTTYAIERDAFTILLETRPTGVDYAFRHRYAFSRLPVEPTPLPTYTPMPAVSAPVPAAAPTP